MKKITPTFMSILALIFFLSIALSSCNNSNDGTESDENYDSYYVEDNDTEDDVPAPTKEEITKKVVNQIKSWGAKDAYLDDEDYFVYGVDKKDLSASAWEVAKAMFPMVEEIPGVKGVKVVDVSSKEVLGEYTKP